MDSIWKCIDGALKPEQLITALNEEKVIVFFLFNFGLNLEPYGSWRLLYYKNMVVLSLSFSSFWNNISILTGFNWMILMNLTPVRKVIENIVSMDWIKIGLSKQLISFLPQLILF